MGTKQRGHFSAKWDTAMRKVPAKCAVERGGEALTLVVVAVLGWGWGWGLGGLRRLRGERAGQVRREQ